MCFSSWDIIFFVTPGFQESKAVSVGQISNKFELRNPCRGNLWKMSQQICVNLGKTAILGKFGLFLDPLGARPSKKKFFWLEVLNYDPHFESLLFWRMF